MLIIAVNLSVSGFDKSYKNRVFSYSVYLATLANICDFLWNLCLTGAVNLPIPVRLLINGVYFISFGFSALCWLLYTDRIQANGCKRRSLRAVLYALPISLLAFLLILNCFNGCLFYIDSLGYHRGGLFYAQQVLSYSYILISTVKCFYRAALRKNFTERSYFLTLSTFVIPPIICGIIQIFLQDIPILSVGIVISYLLAYINTLERLISLDSLTGISNRRDFLQRLEAEIRPQRAADGLYFMFIDVDSFKAVNDIYGHSEGDRVLREVADILKNYVKERNGFCGRYGGDEFAAFVPAENSADIETIRSELENRIKNGVLLRDGGSVTVSTGYSKYLGGDDDIQGMITRADAEMYGVKKERGRIRMK